MRKAKDIMTRDVVTVTPETEILRAAALLLEHHFNGLPVVDGEGRLVGIICKEDLVAQQKEIPIPSFFTLLDGLIPLSSQKAMERELEKITATTVEKAMTRDPTTVDPDTDIDDVASIMVNEKHHTIPVVEGDKLVGVIGKEDVLRLLVS